MGDAGGAVDDYRTLQAIGREEIARGLGELGVGRGETVLVHSAMSRIGHVQSGAGTVVDAFRDVLGREGTLAVPTFPFTSGMLRYVQSDPDFDVDTTPSLMGAITEEVRRRPGAVRSLEPTHPVAALGPQSRWLAEEHVHSEGSCDAHSPLYRLTEMEPSGWVLLLGVDFRNCTLLHTAEEVARVPFVDFETRYRLRGRCGGGAYVMSIYCHSTPLQANFPAIEPALRERGQLTIGRIGQAECRLARAKDVLATALECLEKDPYFLRVRA
jgi:aminoglycoside 3-N-acetyltransferase